MLKNLPSAVVWNVMGSNNFLVLPAVDVSIHSADLSHTPVLDVTSKIMIFPPPNLTVFWVNLGSMRVPTGLLQCLRRLECSSMDDSSEKSTFCHFSIVHPFSKLWALAHATQYFSCLLFNAGFRALMLPLRERI